MKTRCGIGRFCSVLMLLALGGSEHLIEKANGQSDFDRMGAALGREIRNELQRTNPQAVRELDAIGTLMGLDRQQQQQRPGNRVQPPATPNPQPYYPPPRTVPQPYYPPAAPPQVIYVPQSQPQTIVYPSTAVPKNEILSLTPSTPSVKTPVNPVPMSSDLPAIVSKTNGSFLPKPMYITESQQTKILESLKRKVDKDIDGLKAELRSRRELEKEVMKLPSPPFGSEEKSKLISAIEDGDLIAMSDLPKLPEEFQKLQDEAEARSLIEDLSDKVSKGKAGSEDFAEAEAALRKVTGGSSKKITAYLDSLRIRNEIYDVINDADPRTGPSVLPGRGSYSIIHVPGMPAGSLVDLGNGAFLVPAIGRGELLITQGSIWSCLGVASYSSGPISSASKKFDSKETFLTNVSQAAFKYLIDKNAYTMEPTYEQTLDSSRSWTISFDQGGNKGTKVETVQGGIYEASAVDGFWKLNKVQASIQIDNTANTVSFNYLLNNRPESVPAGGKASHSSESRIEVQFDDGSGKTKRKLLRSGIAYVGLNKDATEIDLFSDPPTKPSDTTLEPEQEIGSIFSSP
ncbi:MAG: hypothetical protein NTW52_15565 [Planctomycetota bacterium]|nr:hypothetical protein [Planctomycetota bacterium]